MSRSRVKELLRDGRVVVNGVSVTRFDHLLQVGDRVTVERAPVGGRQRSGMAGILVRFEDDDLIVVEKPAGLLTVATDVEKDDTAFARLKLHLEARRVGRPYVVHRLDRDTSGLLLFARTPQVRDKLQANWDAVQKTYLAVVEGAPRPAAGTVENYLAEGRDLRVWECGPSREGARRAVSHYRTLTGRGRHSLVEVGLGTGRKHQIRVHLAGLGCPVIGDAVYGAATNPAKRLGLHACRLAFDHPTTGRPVEWESPLPESLRRIVEK
jgi:23S rRNA pseudouridine1911/1915/1917 synthase